MHPNRKTINVTDLRVQTREVLENVHFRGCQYVIERAGQPMAVIMSLEEYQRLTMNALPRQTARNLLEHELNEPAPAGAD
jgi:prevent-host-death family protein